MERKPLKIKPRPRKPHPKTKPAVDAPGGQYFAGSDVDGDSMVPRLPSGCALFDCMVSGGRKGCYPEGRVSNIVGDSSAGKTLLAIEAIINYCRRYAADEADVYYVEPEAAFDKGYAKSQGLPIERVTFADDAKDIDTVEAFFELLMGPASKDGKQPVGGVIKKCMDTGRRALVVLDSLDALSDASEMSRDMEKGSYGAEKAKKLSQLFRRVVRYLERYNITLIIVSQVRDKIGVTFGERHTRAGGRALQFYSSVVIWIAQIGKIKKTRNEVERTVGVNIRAVCKKNKVAKPFREVDYPIMFDYGIDDVRAACEWMKEVKRSDVLTGLGIPLEDAAREKWLAKLTDAEFRDIRKRLDKATRKTWREVEDRFAPVRRKY